MGGEEDGWTGGEVREGGGDLNMSKVHAMFTISCRYITYKRVDQQGTHGGKGIGHVLA
jgi:hypothetical protein